MNATQSTHQFADAATAQIRGLQSGDCQLLIRQKPENARVAVGKEKDRKPVDPPPIIQLKISATSDPNQNYLQSPYFFMSCSLASTDHTPLPENLGAALAGTLVSSLHRLKDSDNSDGGFFVFGDLSVKVEGAFRLQFNLYEMRDMQCHHIQSVKSDPFIVHSTKNFPGMSESTFLTRSFSDQGVRLRLRKEPRTLLKKRGPASEDYQPRHYNTQARRQGQQQDRMDRQSHSGSSGESNEASRQGLGDQSGSIHTQQIHSHPYDQRPQGGRRYSHQSTGSFGSYSDEPNVKRPRTGSEQSHQQSLSQTQQPLDSPQYPGRMYTDSQRRAQYSPYSQQQPPQHPGYGLAYPQSSQSAITPSRDQYFAARPDRSHAQGSVNSRNSSPFDANIQRSPAASTYYAPQTQARFHEPQQQQQAQYGVPQTMEPSPHRVQSAFDGIGFVTRRQSSPGMGGSTAMGPPTCGRIVNSPTGAGVRELTSSGAGRRESYGQVPSQSQNLSAGSLGGALIVPRTAS